MPYLPLKLVHNFRIPKKKDLPKGRSRDSSCNPSPHGSLAGWLWHLVDQVAETVNGPVPSRLSS